MSLPKPSKYAQLSMSELFGEIRSALAAKGPKRLESINAMILSRPPEDQDHLITYCKEQLGDYVLRANYAHFASQKPLGNLINLSLSFLQNMSFEEFMPQIEWLAVTPCNIQGLFSKNPYHKYSEIVSQQLPCRGLFLKHCPGGKWQSDFQHFAPSEVLILRMEVCTKTLHLDLSTLPCVPKACIILTSRTGFNVRLKTNPPCPVLVYAKTSNETSELRLERANESNYFTDDVLEECLLELWKAPVEVFTAWIKNRDKILNSLNSWA